MSKKSEYIFGCDLRKDIEMLYGDNASGLNAERVRMIAEFSRLTVSLHDLSSLLSNHVLLEKKVVDEWVSEFNTLSNELSQLASQMATFAINYHVITE